MAKFCGKCGTPLDLETGLCPRCQRQELNQWQRRKKKQSGGARGFFKVLGICLLILVLLAGTLTALSYFDVVDVPVVDDVLENILYRPGPRQLDQEEPEEEAEPEEDTPEAPTETTAVETEPTEPPVVRQKLNIFLQEESFIYQPVAEAYASSTYSGDRATHDVMNLLDDDGTTNWTEGASGLGIGEYVHFDFGETYQLFSIRIRGGNRYSSQRYLDNARPENVTLTFSDGTSCQFYIHDVMESQTFILDTPVMTDSVRITIDSAYRGRRYQDTVISDVSFDARQVKGTSMTCEVDQGKCTGIVFLRHVDGTEESATIMGLGGKGTLWSYETGLSKVGQCQTLAALGAQGSTFYFTENGAVIALDLETGKVRWKNDEFGGAPSAQAFDQDGKLYICGFLGPDLMVIDENGKTVHRVEGFDEGYYWPCDIQLDGRYALITMDGHPDDISPADSVIRVDLRDFSYQLPEQ